MRAWSSVGCCGRNLVITAGGLAAICALNIENGDVLVCLYGMHMPWILRPEKDFYTIRGGVYIHGLTDWSALDECYGRGELREATIRIG